MTARKPIVLVGNATSDLAAADTLDPLACFGYVPARPSGYYSAAFSTANNLSYPGYASLGTLQFTATAPNVSAVGRAAMATSDAGSSETTYAYLDIYDNTGTTVVATGVTDIGTATSTAYTKMVAGAGYAGLAVGRTYTVRFWASQSDSGHNVTARNPVLEIRNY